MEPTQFNCLAIIPARGGSKGVPGKNIRLLDGKPLLAYAIETALGNKHISRCIVNTDDAEIAAVARKYQSEVMMREPGQGEDHSLVLPVILSTLAFANSSSNKPYDVIILLQATAPLRSSADIDKVMAMLGSDSAPDAVISVVQVGDGHPARMYTLGNQQEMLSLDPTQETMRRQELSSVYLRNGCIYAVKTSALLKEQTLMVKNKQAYIMPAEWLANIDTERDFLLTEILIKQWKQVHGTF